jgi:hypothetical protein
MLHRLFALAGSLLAYAAAGGEQSDGAAEMARDDSVLSAYAFASYSPLARLRLDPRSDDADDVALLADVRMLLEQRGHVIDPAATQVLSFGLIGENDTIQGGSSTRNDADHALRFPLGQVGNARTQLNVDEEGFHLRVVLPLGTTGTHARSGQRRHGLSVELDDRQAARRIWSGEVHFNAPDAGHLAVARVLLPVLLDALGQTVGPLRIHLD